MSITAKELADAYANATARRRFELLNAGPIGAGEANDIYRAGVAAIEQLLIPLLKDQERLDGIIAFGRTYKSRAIIDQYLMKREG